MTSLPRLSGREVVKVLCNKLGFEITGRAGSHVRLSKTTSEGKVGTVVPMHQELRTGTLKNVLRLARISEEKFLKHL